MSFEVNFLKEIEKKRHQGQNRMKSEKLKKLNHLWAVWAEQHGQYT